MIVEKDDTTTPDDGNGDNTGSDDNANTPQASAPEIGKAYYLSTTTKNGTSYFNGTISSGLKTTTNVNEAVKVGVEYVSGTTDKYLIYFYVGDAKYYLVDAGGNTTSISCALCLG